MEHEEGGEATAPDEIAEGAAQGPCHPGSCGTELDRILKTMEAVIIIKPVGGWVSTLTL